jgi:hypothetical protein
LTCKNVAASFRQTSQTGQAGRKCSWRTQLKNENGASATSQRFSSLNLTLATGYLVYDLDHEHFELSGVSDTIIMHKIAEQTTRK